MNSSLFLTVALVTLLGCHYAVGSPVQKVSPELYAKLAEGRADASEYVDLLLANVRDLMGSTGLGRVNLPNATMGFEQVIGGINWHGEAALTGGYLENLDTLHRTGKAEISIEDNGDLVILTEVGVNEGTLHYAVAVTFMDLGPHATADGKLSQVRLLMELRVQEDLIVHLDTFKIKSTGHLSLDVKGLGLILNFLVELLVEFVGNIVKPIVVAIMEGPIKDIVNKILMNIRFPPDTYQTITAIQPLFNVNFPLVI